MTDALHAAWWIASPVLALYALVWAARWVGAATRRALTPTRKRQP